MGHSTLATVRDLAPLIAQHADEAERERRLARPVVDALVNAGLFRLLVPQAWVVPAPARSNSARSSVARQDPLVLNSEAHPPDIELGQPVARVPSPKPVSGIVGTPCVVTRGSHRRVRRVVGRIRGTARQAWRRRGSNKGIRKEATT